MRAGIVPAKKGATSLEGLTIQGFVHQVNPLSKWLRNGSSLRDGHHGGVRAPTVVDRWLGGRFWGGGRRLAVESPVRSGDEVKLTKGILRHNFMNFAKSSFRA